MAIKKETKSSKTKSSKTKIKKSILLTIVKIIWFLFLVVGMILIGSIILSNNQDEFGELYNDSGKNTELPVSFFVTEDQKYNSMLPFLNELDGYYFEDTVTRIQNDEEINIYINKKGIEDVKCQIIDPVTNTELAEIMIAEDMTIDYEAGTMVTFNVDILEEDIFYLFTMTLNYEGRTINYYQNVVNKSISDATILEEVKEQHQDEYAEKAEVESYIGDDKFVVLNDVDYNIYYINEEESIVEVSYVIVNKKENEYIYWDFVETYVCGYSWNDVLINNYYKMASQDTLPIYDDVDKVWRIEDSSSVNNEIHYSDNEKFAAFEVNGELWFWDIGNNQLFQINKQDSVDGDYYIDESRHYQYSVFDISNDGNLKYMKLGYQGSGINTGYNGIEILEFDYKLTNNRSMYFIPFDMWYSTLSGYIENKMDYNSLNNMGILELNGDLYVLDFDNNKIKYLQEINDKYLVDSFGNSIEFNEGLVDNQVIRFENVFDQNTVSYEVFYEGYNVRLIETFDEGMLIGKYHADEIYEFLNTEYLYPYYELCLVDYSGEEIKTFKADDHVLLGNVNFNSKGFFVSTYKVEPLGYLYENSGIRYRKLETMTINYSLSKHIDTFVTKAIKVEDRNEKSFIILEKSNNPNSEYQILDVSEFSQTGYNVKEQDYIYEIYDNDTLIDRCHNLEQCLTDEHNSDNIKIIYKDKLEGRQVLIDSEIPNSAFINVPKIKKPEDFIDGEEIVSLTMLQNYSNGTSYTPYDIANQIRVDDSSYYVENQLIHYGNMHSGYVGDFFDSNIISLGVYIEPLYQLATKLSAEKVYQISDLTYDEMVTFLGNGYPMLVLYVDDSNVIREDFQVIKTPLGYMEISPSQKSVVVRGYDENYFYYNDPLSGKVEKAEKKLFYSEIDELGGQGLVIIEDVD